MKRVAVIGANGQLGSDLIKTLTRNNWSVASLLHRQIEVKSPWSVSLALKKIKPQIVINTAAFHLVEECERQPEEAFRVNAMGVKNLAQWCQKNQATLVQISTDYVFGADENRKRPYTETDPVAPVNTYGISKLAGEFWVKAILKQYFIIRTSGLYGLAGSSVKGSNFIDRIVERAKRKEIIKMVNDQIFVPTYTKNLAENLNLLLRTKKFGVYHVVSQGKCSWYQLAKTVFELAGLKTRLVPIKTVQTHSFTFRPGYSVLINANLKKLKLDIMRPWQENLKLYLKEKGYLK